MIAINRRRSPAGTKSALISSRLKGEIKTLTKLFFHRPQDCRKVYAIQQPTGSYYPGRGGVTPSLILQHLKGKVTLGAYQLTDEDKIKWIAWDIDTELDLHPARLPAVLDEFSDLRKLVLNIHDSACASGRRAYLSASGRRGFHLYLFVESQIPASRGRFLGEQVLSDLHIPSGVSIEIYPKQTHKGDGLGSSLKVPWGIHQVTDHRTQFVDRHFEPITLKPSKVVTNPASTVPGKQVNRPRYLPRYGEEADFDINQQLPADFKKLLKRDLQIKNLFYGKGKSPGQDLSRSGYDFSLARALINKGIKEPDKLATILWHRPKSKAQESGYNYLQHTVSKALAQFTKQQGGNE